MVRDFGAQNAHLGLWMPNFACYSDRATSCKVPARRSDDEENGDVVFSIFATQPDVSNAAQGR